MKLPRSHLKFRTAQAITRTGGIAASLVLTIVVALVFTQNFREGQAHKQQDNMIVNSSGLGVAASGGARAEKESSSSVLKSCPLASPEVLDFFEVGTCDFDALIQEAEKSVDKDTIRGVSVDALSIYLDKLPQLPNTKKLNYGVVGTSPHSTTLDIYYIHPDDIKANDLGWYLKGSNRLGEPNKIAKDELETNGKQDLMRHQAVSVRSIAELLTEQGGCRVKKLKLDVEGRDPELLLGYAGFLWQHPECYADELMFEFNELSPDAEQRFAVAALAKIGFMNEGSHKVGSGNNPDWRLIYRPEHDARRWMVRSLQQMGQGGKEFFDEEAMTAVLGGKILPLANEKEISIDCLTRESTTAEM